MIHQAYLIEKPDSSLWSHVFSDSLRAAGLDVTKKEEYTLCEAVDNLICLYGDEMRVMEDIPAYEHPLQVNDFMLDAFKGFYKDSRLRVPGEFSDFFRANYLLMSHVNLNHDIIEKNKMSKEDVKDFYESRSMDGCLIADAIYRVSLPRRPDTKVTRSNQELKDYITKINENPFAYYCKVFDSLDNSETPSSNNQFRKMHFYIDLFQTHFPSLLSHFRANISRNNLEKILGIRYHEDHVAVYAKRRCRSKLTRYPVMNHARHFTDVFRPIV